MVNFFSKMREDGRYDMSHSVQNLGTRILDHSGYFQRRNAHMLQDCRGRHPFQAIDVVDIQIILGYIEVEG